MDSFRFGKFNISPSEIFYESEYCVGLVNLKPIVPGHVLVVPKRVALRFSDLTINEITDLTRAAKHISEVLKDVFVNMKEGNVWLIQDGREAGQTIPHVHLHIIPKRFSEWFDDGIEDIHRKPRSVDDMKEEAESLKIKFKTL